MRRFSLQAILALLLSVSSAQETTAQSVPECPGLSLYCIQLLPTARFQGAIGHVELARPDSPFGIAVTREGHQRYRLVVDIEGLPDPETVGSFDHWVLWASPLVMNPMVNLGEVGNGHFEIDEVDFDKFVLIVSPEPRPDVSERTGPLALRARSPSSRMEPHTMFQLSAATSGLQDAHAGHGGEWPHPATHPRITMIPGMATLKPSVSPWEPPGVEGLPEARARSVHRMAEGDSLTLRAQFVRKRVGAREFTMLGYNGEIPGPLIDVAEEATITVQFINDTPFESSIHWHGLRHDNRFDGVPGLTQPPVAPADTFVYTVHFPDAGIYWYHPHHREDIQQDLGLYGNMIVRSPDMLPAVEREEILVFDDLTVAPTGNVPYGQEDANYTLMGRFGNTLLVNGEPRVDLDAATGQTLRLYLTNVANTRTLNLSVDGHAVKVMATDLGPFEQETWAESVPMAPAERYVVDLQFSRPGDFPLVNHVQALNHATGVFFAERDTLAVIRVSGEVVAALPRSEAARADVAAEIEPFRQWFDAEPSHEVELFLRTRGLDPLVDWMLKADQAYFHPVEWSGTMPMMNWSSTTGEAEWVMREPSTGRENMDIDWRFARDSVAKLRIHNLRESLHGMQHPIHLHGQRFLVVAYNGRPTDNLAWKDTVLIPAGMTADIVVEFTNPGAWMMHCHIAEHLEAGMMMAFHVD